MPVETKIKRRLKKAGITMAALCDKIGVKYFTMSCYLNGYNPMPNNTKEKINKYLNSVENKTAV